MSRRHAIGMTVGAVWLIVASTAFATAALSMIRTATAAAVLVAAIGAATVLVVMGINYIRAVLRLPGDMPTQTPDEQNMRSRFMWIVAAEIVALAIVNSVLGATHHILFLVPLNLIIVGIHFLPLAKVFKVPRYSTMGGLFSAIAVFTMLGVPREAHLGGALSWFVLPSLGCALVATITAMASLREVRGFVKRESAVP